MVLYELFPDLRDALADDGVPIVDVGESARFQWLFRWTPLRATGIKVPILSRPYLENHLRRRVLGLDNVTVVGGFDVDGLAFVDASRITVSGVHGRLHGQPVRIAADLIVDASGRCSRLHRWLTAAGLPPPDEHTVSAGFAYTTRVYQGHPVAGPLLQASLPHAPAQRRGGGYLAVERDQCHVVLFGVEGDACPTDEDSFASFAASLPTRLVADFLADHLAVGRAYRFADLGNRWRLLHRYPHWPHRLVALGDTVCVFNPIYAQGMTVAALQALALGESLDRAESTRAFQRRAASVVGAPWFMATSADLAWKDGKVPLASRLAQWYLGLLLARVPDNPDLYRRFALVQHMRANPATLLSPIVIRGLMRHPARSAGEHDQSGPPKVGSTRRMVKACGAKIRRTI